MMLIGLDDQQVVGFGHQGGGHEQENQGIAHSKRHKPLPADKQAQS
jgi:hypothetical protein